jgi:sugar/nucleoside kinase (ribokinase family)
LRLSVDEPVLVFSGVGRDMRENYADFFERWKLETTGLIIQSSRTPRTLVTYGRSGDREEQSLLGEDHFREHSPTLPAMGTLRGDLIGLYTFQESMSPKWAELMAARRASDFVLLWELSAIDHGPDGWSHVVARLDAVDVVSLNRTEGRSLTGYEDPYEIAVCFVQHGAKVVILRDGANGSYVVSDDQLLHANAVLPNQLVDPTGAGNAYSGAFLGAWATGHSLEEAARLAGAAASFMLEQHGPPDTPPNPELVVERAARVWIHRADSGWKVPV